MIISLNILGRAPIPGYAKSRLIPLLGPLGAARAHEHLLSRVTLLAQRWCRAGKAGERLLRLWGDPDCSHPFFSSLLPSAHLRTQPGGTLGERLEWIHHCGLAEAEAVILLGGDAGSLQESLLEQAATALHTVPVVLAPTEDGGYILLGLRRPAPELFTAMAWGSDEVAEQTRHRLRHLAWPWHELPRQWDVDRPGEWHRFESMMSAENNHYGSISSIPTQP